MLAQRLRRWPNIIQMLYKCVVCWVKRSSQQIRGVEQVLVRCWASVADGGPALGQRRVCWEC